METPTASTFGLPNPEDSTKSWTPQARNPVSVRLYKVLGTNFSDNATKEALYTLSDLYATTNVISGKTTDVKRDNAGELDEEDTEEDPDPPDSGKAPISYANVLSEATPGESAARARKNLRRDMENKLADGSRQFLKVFGEVDQVCQCQHLTFFVYSYACFLAQKLDELQEHINAMRASCEQAEAQLQVTDKTSKTLLEHAGKLQQERYASWRHPRATLFLQYSGRK
jgi:conserved oligomeric Golgi complex subunit 6